MENIPEDIRHTAFVALEDWYRRTPDDVANAVARAILAERERCVEIALSNAHEECDVAEAIARAIRQ